MISPRSLSFLSLFTFLLFVSCNGPREDNIPHTIAFDGKTQGTTYMVKYHGDSIQSFHEEIDSILSVIDSSLSLWIDSSTISKFNTSEQLSFQDGHFARMLWRSREIADRSYGAFNPMLAPVIEAWGFGRNEAPTADTSAIDSLLDLSKWSYEISPELTESNFETAFQVKKPVGTEVNFNAIAQGYTVDVLCDFLSKKNVENYLVEIGGEVRAAGESSSGDPWKIGVDRPQEDIRNRQIMAVIPVGDRALATSGSYRKFYEVDGNRYSHTIDPRDGYPVKHNLLSATVMAENCTDADAYATAFMVMGMDSTLSYIRNHPELDLEALLIASADSGKFRIESTDRLSEEMELVEPKD